MNGPSDTPVREAPKTEVLVINLADVKDRMAFQEAQMAELGLNATRVDAVAKQAIPEEELADYSRRAPRPLVGGHLACLLSHGKCWEHVVKTGRCTLVVEDDVVLSSRLPDVLDWLATQAEQQLVNLETFLDYPKYLTKTPVAEVPGGACDLYGVIKGSAGSAAYIIGPETARKLLRALKGRVNVPDTFLGINSGKRNLQTVPALAAQMMTMQAIYGADFREATQSTIWTVEDLDASGAPKRHKKNTSPGAIMQRLSLELRVGFEKFEAALTGQKLTIQPCPDMLERWAQERT